MPYREVVGWYQAHLLNTYPIELNKSSGSGPRQCMKNSILVDFFAKDGLPMFQKEEFQFSQSLRYNFLLFARYSILSSEVCVTTCTPAKHLFPEGEGGRGVLPYKRLYAKRGYVPLDGVSFLTFQVCVRIPVNPTILFEMASLNGKKKLSSLLKIKANFVVLNRFTSDLRQGVQIKLLSLRWDNKFNELFWSETGQGFLEHPDLNFSKHPPSATTCYCYNI